MQIEKVRFIRAEGAPAEYGIMFGGNEIIIDKNCELVPTPVWNWQSVGQLLIHVDLEN